MELVEYGAIAGIVVMAILVIGVIIGFARGWFSFFAKVRKIDGIEKGVDALLIIHASDLITLYKDKIKLVFNPNLSPEKDELLLKLESGYLTSSEASRLIEILRVEEIEAERKNQQMAFLTIGALILLVALVSEKKKS